MLKSIDLMSLSYFSVYNSMFRILPSMKMISVGHPCAFPVGADIGVGFMDLKFRPDERRLSSSKYSVNERAFGCIAPLRDDGI